MGVKIGEANPGARQRVNIWRSNFSAKGTDVRLANIIGENYHYVGSFGSQGHPRRRSCHK